MSSEKTISQILNQIQECDKAFWVTYSIDFGTLDFLLKKDLKHSMSLNYLHVICDQEQFTSAVQDSFEIKQDLSKLIKLREYCTISEQATKGAFHPKIFILGSKDTLTCIIMSANLTSSGVLSNQDLIAVYQYSDEDKAYGSKINSILTYVDSFSGWSQEAHVDLGILKERFPGLKESADDSFCFIPNSKGMIDQMIPLVENFDYNEVICFSPFFDPDFKALKELQSRTKRPVKAYNPNALVECSEALNNKYINIFTTKGSNKPSFHAKFYQFKGNEKSICFWGSANCSYSGLINNARNFEVLLKEELLNEEVDQLWGNSKTDDKVEFKITKDRNDDSDSHTVIIGNIEQNEERITFSCIAEKTQFKATSGVEAYDLKVSKFGNVFSFEDDQEIILFWKVDADNERISNFGYVNRPELIKRRLEGESRKDRKLDFSKQDKKTFESIFDYFNVKEETKRHHANSRIMGSGFWQMSNFSAKKTTIKITSIKNFINRELDKYHQVSDDDNEELGFSVNNAGIKSQKEKLTLIGFIDKQVNNLVGKNLTAIENKNLIQLVDWDDWRIGLTHLLTLLCENELLSELFYKNKYPRLLTNLSILLIWYIDRSVDEVDEDLKVLVGLLIFLGQVHTQYYQRVIKKRASLNKQEAIQFDDINKLYQFAKYKLGSYSVEGVRIKEMKAKLLEEARAKALRPKFVSPEFKEKDIKVYKNRLGEEFLFIGNIEPSSMELMTVSGSIKKYSKDAPLEKKIITSNCHR